MIRRVRCKTCYSVGYWPRDDRFCLCGTKAVLEEVADDSMTCDKCWRPYILVQRGSTAEGIVCVCAEVQALLLQKNTSYGDSATSPARIFSKADPIEQIKVRIDDKLSRLMKGNDAYNEDVVMDLIGYLILLRVAEKGSKT